MMHVTLDDGQTVAVTGAVAAMVARLVRAQEALARFGQCGHYQVRLHVEGKDGQRVRAQVLTTLDDTIQ